MVEGYFIFFMFYCCVHYSGTIIVSFFRCTKQNECGNSEWLKADPTSDSACWNNTASPKSVARASPEAVRII